jgi:hypothetical protein
MLELVPGVAVVLPVVVPVAVPVVDAGVPLEPTLPAVPVVPPVVCANIQQLRARKATSKRPVRVRMQTPVATFFVTLVRGRGVDSTKGH